MTLFDFAHAHPFIAVFFALLASGTVITVVAMFVTWRIARPVKYTAADRAALNEGAARLRQAARRFGEDGYPGTESKVVEAAEQLERMASR